MSFKPDVISYNDYYPFGMLQPNRNSSSTAYRYGFQGQEKDDEVKDGNGTSINYKYRMHDPRVGRFFAADPLEHKFPWMTPYAFTQNKVIMFVELEGLQPGSARPYTRPTNAFRNRRNRQLYRVNQARRQADFYREQKLEVKPQFNPQQSVPYRNMQAFIKKFNLAPNDPTNSVGSAPPIAEIVEETMNLVKGIESMIKRREFQYTQGQYSIDINQNSVIFQFKNPMDYFKLMELDKKYKEGFAKAHEEYRAKFDENLNPKEEGSTDIYSFDLFLFQYKLENGASPSEMLENIMLDALKNDQLDVKKEKTIYLDRITQG